MYACTHGNMKIIQLLLDTGASVTVKDASGKTVCIFLQDFFSLVAGSFLHSSPGTGLCLWQRLCRRVECADGET